MKIYIDGRIAKDYTVNEIVFNFDSISDTFSLSRPFFEHWEKNRKDNNETYRMFTPLRYYDVKIYDNSGKNLLLTGTLLNHKFSSKSESNQLSISGYSKTGILGDCSNVQEMLKDSLEVEEGTEGILAQTDNTVSVGDEDNKTGESSDFSDISLLDFAKKLCAPFGIEVVYDDIVKDKVLEKYDSTQVKENETIAGCLSKLATMKNIVLRCNNKGQLLFTQIDTTQKPVINFGADSRIFDAELNVTGQGMHSIIYLTGAVPLEEEDDAEQVKSGDTVSIKNPLVTKYRPIVKKQSSEKGTLVDPVKAVLANELKGISINISCVGWDFVDDNVIKTGDLITLKCPDIYIYQTTKLVVSGITLKEDKDGKSQTLNCRLLESYTGEKPSLIF